MLGPRLWLVTVSLLTGGGMLTAVGNPATTRVARADEADPPFASRAAAEGILVMRNGMVVKGRILKRGNDYEVLGPQGSQAFYPGAHVKLHAANLSEACQKLSESALAQQSANAHILLGKWCLTNHLASEARQELLEALKREPDRDDAKRLLRDAEESLRGDNKPSPAVVVHDDPLRTPRQTAATDDAVSLGGLSREQGVKFARRIQPLLMNNCTASGCHGRDSQSGFRLYKVTPGQDANRHAAERNLAEVLACIDVENPRASSLLTAPKGRHGRRGRAIFAGARGDDQYTELKKWVFAVAAEEASREKRGEGDGRRKSNVLPVSSSGGGQDARNQGSAVRPGARLPAAKPFPSPAPDAKLPSQPPLPVGRGDPFDATAFNRGSDRRPAR